MQPNRPGLMTDSASPLDSADAALSAEFMEWDLETFPHVVGRVKPTQPSDQVTAAMLRCFDRLVSGPQRITVLFDVTDAKLVPVSFLKRIAKFMQACKPKVKLHLHCSTVVCGLSTKMLLDLFFTFFTPARPNQRFRTEAEAVNWTLQQWVNVRPPANTENELQ